MYICVGMHIYIYVGIRTDTYVCMHACMYACMYVCTPCMYICHVRVRMYYFECALILLTAYLAIYICILVYLYDQWSTLLTYSLEALK